MDLSLYNGLWVFSSIGFMTLVWAFSCWTKGRLFVFLVSWSTIRGIVAFLVDVFAYLFILCFYMFFVFASICRICAAFWFMFVFTQVCISTCAFFFILPAGRV